ncbi:MAG: YigZ family protein [Bacteroidales bacterium]
MLFEDTYKTIKKPTEGIYKDKGSKFFSYAFPVTSLEEIKEKQDELRNKHHSARHHCYAYILGYDKSAMRMNDDGEPSGSAGRPIMGQIQSFDLTNVLVVVVRYFGGTKLGIRGLIDAYKFATFDALDKAMVVKRTVNEVFNLEFNYPQMNQVMKIVKDEKLKVIGQEFALTCNLTYSIRKRSSSAIYDMFSNISGLKINFLRQD